MKYCVFCSAVVCFDLVGHIDEGHEFINIDLTVVVSVHFSEKASHLIDSDFRVASFDDK